MRQGTHRRAILWSLAFIVAAAILLPMSGYVYVAFAQQEADNPTAAVAERGGAALGAQGWQGDNPRAESWRQARQGNAGVTTVGGPEAGVLIQNGGENWRQVRNGPVAGLTPWLMAIALVGIALVWVISGRHRLHEPRSGYVVPRWKLWERVLHWVVATLFIILAITGLSLLFGRAVLIPVLGPEGFAAWATVAMNLHNYIGPFFTLCVAVMVLAWVWFNIPSREDWGWFKAGGGFLKGRTLHAGRFNGGEKVWFWFVALVGGAVCVTGVILDFPNLEQTRSTMQTANIIHAVAAIAWISLFFGHAYIGTVGTEGALEGMTTGYVSREWATQHHDRWYEQVKDREQPESAVRGGERRHGESDTAT
ncbi:formate dehydrogenase subunit gamma [Arhodomonas sp. SL1]|uniref:formate dehydrogenase subunit gamma n=1 Tax=Arhodomonas sp. SL1 TaxID=3425691 RepID=UPI003F883CA0